MRRQTASFIGESVRPVRRYFSKEAKSRLIRQGRALDNDDEGMRSKRKAKARYGKPLQATYVAYHK